MKKAWKKILVLMALFCIPASAQAGPSDEALDQVKRKKTLADQAKVIRQGIMKKGPHFSVEGTLKAHGNNVYSVNGLKFTVSDKTRTSGSLQEGSKVRVSGYRKSGGNVARVVNSGMAMSSTMRRRGGSNIAGTHTTSGPTPGDFQNPRRKPQDLPK